MFVSLKCLVWFMKYYANVRRTVADFSHAPLNEYSPSPDDKKQWSLVWFDFYKIPLCTLMTRGKLESETSPKRISMKSGFSRHAAWIGGTLIQFMHTYKWFPVQVKDTEDPKWIRLRTHAKRQGRERDSRNAVWHGPTNGKEGRWRSHVLWAEIGEIWSIGPELVQEITNKDLDRVIMEYLVNISKRRAIWSINEDILKITILKTNMPYPSRKIRRIRACTHQRPQRNEAQYAKVNLDNSTNNVLIPLDSWTSGLLVYKSPLSGTESRLRPYHFNYPERSLTMEEMLNKFIDEGKREHDEMRAFIYDFQTTKELLFKERNNSLIELRFRVQELLKVIKNVPMIDYDVKGVTTRGGKTTTQDDHDNNTNVLPKELLVVDLEKPVRSNDVLTNDQPQMTSEPVVHPSNEVQTPPVPFPRRLRKEKRRGSTEEVFRKLKQLHINLPFIEALAQIPKYAKFLKGLLTNKARLEEACKITINERCFVVLLNKLPLKEKEPGSFTIPYDIGQLHMDNALADLGASISLMSYTMYEKLGLGEPKATRTSLELADRGLEKTIDQSDLEYCESADRNNDEDSDLKNPIRRINFVNTPYQVVQEITERDKVKSEHLYSTSANEIDEKKPELKNLPPHLEYAYLNGDKSFPIIISSKLSKKEKMSLLQVLEKHKGAISWKMSDIKGINSSWVSLIHVLNDNNELIPSRTVTGWRVCIDYRKLNDATRKDHFPLPFIDQMLEHLCGNEYYCFLDGFSRFFQILISPGDQEKTTFTCPYGTFTYRRMPFGLCNAPATFQRCMTAIFHDMVEDFMKVFMDDFLVIGNSFDCCLANLDRMLSRCEKINLVLNWEKCYFMVKEGIILGHKIYGAGIEVDIDKIDVIAKLPYPTNVKGVRNFLTHAGFYRRFIKDFSMIFKPMTQLLMKDVKFDFSDDCKKAFNILKEKLTTAPIIISPDWNVPFELMCDASDFAVGAVLGQRIDGKFKPIYYASKTLNNAKKRYTSTEKKLLAVVFSFDKFRQYLVLSKTVVYTDHSTLKYLFSKQDTKPRLIRWVLLL
ncbi:reverse transcriptase domain-containing protein [Tanacetum coccineum]